jgi:2-dehydropantoate 2-reductase
MGVKIPDSMEEDNFNRFMNVQPDGATSSLRRDMDACRPNELETFSGYLLELAEQYELNIPTTKQFYSALKSR